MSTSGEHKTVQACILKYAQAIGWTYVPRDEAERRRCFDSETFSLSVDENGMLRYAAFLGAETIRGSQAFQGSTPRELVDMIGRVNAG